MKDAFELANLPVLKSFLKLDPQGLPSVESTEFPTYGENEIKELYNHYGTRKYVPRKNRNHWRPSWCTYRCNFDWICRIWKLRSTTKSSSFGRTYCQRKTTKAKYLLVDSQKYKTRKQVKAIKAEFELTTKRKSSPLSVEDYEITLSKPHSLMFDV